MTTTNLPPTITDATVTAAQSWVVAALGSGKYCGYCTIADVQQEFLDQNQMPSSTGSNVIARQIVNAALEIQSVLNPIFTMPYAGSDAQILGRLSEMNTKLAASLVYGLQFGAAEPNASTIATDLRSYVFQQLTSLVHGEERWETSFGDATPRADQPAYSKSSLALSGNTVPTSPNVLNPPTFGWDFTNVCKPTI